MIFYVDSKFYGIDAAINLCMFVAIYHCKSKETTNNSSNKKLFDSIYSLMLNSEKRLQITKSITHILLYMVVKIKSFEL